KADCEADFFFMDAYDVDGISVRNVVVAEPPLPRQHFFQFWCDCPRVVSGAQMLGKLFSQFFEPEIVWLARIFARWRSTTIRMRIVSALLLFWEFFRARILGLLF